MHQARAVKAVELEAVLDPSGEVGRMIDGLDQAYWAPGAGKDVNLSGRN